MCLFMACLVNNKYNNNVFGLNYTYVRVCTKGWWWCEAKTTIFGERWTVENTKTQNDTTIAHILSSESALCPQLNSKQAIAICLSFIAIQLIFLYWPTTEWDAGEKCIIYLQNEANRKLSRWEFVQKEKKIFFYGNITSYCNFHKFAP